MCLSLRLAIQVTAPFRHRANIRDGIEDWELLSRLGHDSDTLISNAADLIRQTVRSDTEREEDPGLLERLRRDAARRIIAMKHDDLTVRLRLNGLGPPFLDRFATVSDRFSGSWCRFLESWGQDGEDGEKTGKKRRKMGEKWPKESGSNDGLTANAE